MKEQCKECGAYIGHHAVPTCTLMTAEERAAMATYYYEAWRKKCDDQHAIIVKFQQYAVMWQGKHAMLRHENNKLRRALYRQTKTKTK